MKAAPKQTNNDSSRSATEATQTSWQNQLAQFANNSKEAVAQRAFIAGINDSPHMAAQRRQIENYIGTDSQQAPATPQQINQQPVQRLEKPDDEEKELLQRKPTVESPTQLKESIPKNNTGLPDNLKSGIESLSGLSMDNVKVHYNSSQPAQLNALAYAQGTDIHIAPGQEQHLPHEAWHVVQQAQGRVQPTMQMKNGVPVNDDQGLEHEADVMGVKAEGLPVTQESAAKPTSFPLASGTFQYKPVIQGLFGSLTDLFHNQRKVGVEITEGKAGGNGLSKAQPGATWAGVADKAGSWTSTVQFPDDTGADQAWHIATAASIGAHFVTRGSKSKWMKWDNVTLTEDYGEYEWIVKHPDAPQGVSEYRTRLNAVNTSRQALRTGLSGKGGNQLIVSKNIDPGPNDAFYINLGATEAVSSQVTFETTDRDTTVNALVGGLAYGLDRPRNQSRTAVPVVDPVITDYLNRAVDRVPVADTSMSLVVAYLMADLSQKMATMISGPAWGGDIAANFKDWRILFPKSHPFYITQMAMDGAATVPKITAVRTALTGQKVQILRDLTEMFTKMIMKKGPRLMWTRSGPNFAVDHNDIRYQVDNTLPAYNRIMNDYVMGGVKAQHAARTNDLETLMASGASATFLGDEFDNTVAAMTDNTKTAVNVVRSSSFSQHGADDKAFTFEDRAEVTDTFPDLNETYNRVVAIVDRY